MEGNGSSTTSMNGCEIQICHLFGKSLNDVTLIFGVLFIRGGGGWLLLLAVMFGFAAEVAHDCSGV
jgi:hypothetical protein